jgi:hypothetical protein
MLCDCPLMVSATMFSLSRSPIGESVVANFAREGLFVGADFRKRASAGSLAVSTKGGHRNSVNGSRCHRRVPTLRTCLVHKQQRALNAKKA